MKQYDVRIIETYEETVQVQAESEQAAKVIAERRWADDVYKLGDENFVGADFEIEAVHEHSADAMVYDYLQDMYNEFRETDVEDLARICKTDVSVIKEDLSKTLDMIDRVRNLVAHKL